eukprot:458453-Hanusia_phi.AAC.1
MAHRDRPGLRVRSDRGPRPPHRHRRTVWPAARPTAGDGDRPTVGDAGVPIRLGSANLKHSAATASRLPYGTDPRGPGGKPLPHRVTGAARRRCAAGRRPGTYYP